MMASPALSNAEAVRAAWLAILQKDDISDEDNFFFLGGDSFLGSMLMISIFEATGKEVTLGELYDYPTLSTFTDHVAQKQG